MKDKEKKPEVGGQKDLSSNRRKRNPKDEPEMQNQGASTESKQEEGVMVMQEIKTNQNTGKVWCEDKVCGIEMHFKLVIFIY